jgi:CRP-like cAMP-binding protein
MVTKDDLKQIVMLRYLSDPMLERLAGIVDMLRFDRDDIIFKQDEPAKRFYMLVKGSVLLEQAISENVTACVGAIKPGYSFGWSAMIQDALYTTDAVCVEPSEVLSFKRDKIMKLFEADPEMGYRMHQRLMVIIKKRYDYRTEQFRQAIMHHPDMQELFCTPDF